MKHKKIARKSKREDFLYKIFRVSLIIAHSEGTTPEKVFKELKYETRKFINGIGWEFPRLGVSELGGVHGMLKDRAVKLIGLEEYNNLCRDVDVTYMTKSMEVTKELIKEDPELDKDGKNKAAIDKYLNQKLKDSIDEDDTVFISPDLEATLIEHIDNGDI